MEIKITDMKPRASVLLIHLLTNFHIHLNSYPLPLPLTGTASVVELFATVDNSSNRHGVSSKTFRTFAFFSVETRAEVSCRNDYIQRSCLPASKSQPLCSQLMKLSWATAICKCARDVSQVFSADWCFLFSFSFFLILFCSPWKVGHCTATEMCVFMDNSHAWYD